MVNPFFWLERFLTAYVCVESCLTSQLPLAENVLYSGSFK